MQHRRLKAENRSLDGKKLRFVFKPLASIKAVESPRKAREKNIKNALEFILFLWFFH